jgi:hypothetical protein
MKRTTISPKSSPTLWAGITISGQAEQFGYARHRFEQQRSLAVISRMFGPARVMDRPLNGVCRGAITLTGRPTTAPHGFEALRQHEARNGPSVKGDKDDVNFL